MKGMYIIILLAIFAILIIHVGIAYGIYWLFLYVGAPKYVALGLALGYFIFGGWFANIQNSLRK